MSNFTKGEWEVTHFGSKAQIFCDHKMIVGDLYDEEHEPTLKELEANAHLIAASPEMYQVLTRIKFLIDSGDWQPPKGFCETEINWINSVLAKAEGK